MGVDIFLKSGKKEFSYRLYWIANLIDEYGWCYKKHIPELVLGKKLAKKEAASLLSFLEFCLLKLKNDKKKSLKRFDSVYFKKTEGIYQSLKQLIDLVEKKRPIEAKLFPKLQGLLKRMESYTGVYGQDPKIQKEETAEDFDERISLVENIIPLLKRIVTIGGSVRID
ncbi:hypothetical protein MUP32_04825 [Candidatus Microgenomates bacterium]|nr:hypothetical protein [Candidatus Microgenomates bacterium]